MCSGSQSGMLKPLISAVIFFRWPGLVTPMAVRSSGVMRLMVGRS